MSTVPERHYLSPLFEPESMAIVGASENPGSVGAVLMQNMREAGYRGALYPVNPKHRSVFGVPCHASLAALPQRPELVVIATPAQTVPGLIDECGQRGVRAAAVISAGFGEAGAAGVELQRALLENARRHGVRVLGPNCLGLMRPSLGLDATFAHGGALEGSLGLISQSGAVCTAMLDWARPAGVGFSSVVSLGASADLDFGELIDYLVEDARTAHILLYIEGIRDARRFVSALRAAARVKPVILMKVGRHPAGSRAAVSHTGAIVGLDDVFDAAVRRTGVVRVDSLGAMVAAAQALAARIRPQGERLAIVTNGGGPGVMAADRAADLRLPLAELSAATIASLKEALPASWSHGNPVDLIGDADAARYSAAMRACLADENVDGVLAMLTPQAMTDAEAAARAVIDEAKKSEKPVLACWMGEAQTAGARRLLAEAGIPAFRTPDPAVETFAHLSAFYRNQRALLRTPGPLSKLAAPDPAAARALIGAALAEGRTVLSETESKDVLEAFRIPVAKSARAATEEDAVRLADAAGYPVALKIDSPDITHKSDVNGVRLDVADAKGVREGYRAILADAARLRPGARLKGVVVEPMVGRHRARELMAGLVRDPVFGPAVVFGAGGTAIEVLRDRAVALPPLDAFLVADMIRGTRVAKMLGAFRNLAPADMKAIESVLLRVSEIACELPEIAELDVNPLLADERGAVAVDARIALRAAPQARRFAHLAIHPYPAEYIREWQPAGLPRVTLRPIRPEDADIEKAFVRSLSPESRYFRFMDTVKELAPALLVRFTQIDYDRDMALIAVEESGAAIGICRYATNPDGESCEFALVVADAWKRRGLGRRLMRSLIEVARERGLKTMIGHVLAENHAMLAFCASLGFVLSTGREGPTVRRATLAL
ncbi:MAG TPA: bifunctional acetate--CoA ligase family protein/GNAT family N-acetyltransferase [Burkholderiales bacterium]|nr:bifunctional acetate--CoA ligase family protein/GNAT family N-acetyltransferase [Burkholderiales bacterium]